MSLPEPLGGVTAVKALMLDRRDNVAVAIRPLAAGEPLDLLPAGVVVRDAIPYGHKLALRAIPAGEPVVKYDETIGRSTADIAPGEHVHVHNVTSDRLPGPR